MSNEAEETKNAGVLASVAKLFRPDPANPPAPPPSCCGECGGGEKKSVKAEEKKS